MPMHVAVMANATWRTRRVLKLFVIVPRLFRAVSANLVR